MFLVTKQVLNVKQILKLLIYQVYNKIRSKCLKVVHNGLRNNLLPLNIKSTLI